MPKLSAVFRYKGGYLWARWSECPKRTLLTAEQDHGFFEGLVTPHASGTLTRSQAIPTLIQLPSVGREPTTGRLPGGLELTE